MKKLFYILFIALLVLGSCSKIKKSQKRIEGQWEIVSYRQTNISGFTTYYNTTGTLTFGKNTDDSFTYVENYTYDGPSGAVTVQREGIGTFTNSLGTDHRLDFILPTVFTLDDCAFILITKDDLKIQQRDAQYTHILVLKND